MQNAVDYVRHNPGMVILVVFSILLGWNTYQVILNNYKFQQTVDEFNDEIAVLELENQKIKYDIEYYKTDSYLEQRARESLNLRAKGEEAIAVPRRDPEDLTTAKKQPKLSILKQSSSNFKEWVDLFTGRARLSDD